MDEIKKSRRSHKSRVPTDQTANLVYLKDVPRQNYQLLLGTASPKGEISFVAVRLGTLIAVPDLRISRWYGRDHVKLTRKRGYRSEDLGCFCIQPEGRESIANPRYYFLVLTMSKGMV